MPLQRKVGMCFSPGPVEACVVARSGPVLKHGLSCFWTSLGESGRWFRVMEATALGWGLAGEGPGVCLAGVVHVLRGQAGRMVTSEVWV